MTPETKQNVAGLIDTVDEHVVEALKELACVDGFANAPDAVLEIMAVLATTQAIRCELKLEDIDVAAE